MLLMKTKAMNKFIKSLSFAIDGVKNTSKTEANFRIHLILGSIVLISSVILSISTIEWMIVLLHTGLV